MKNTHISSCSGDMYIYMYGTDVCSGCSGCTCTCTCSDGDVDVDVDVDVGSGLEDVFLVRRNGCEVENFEIAMLDTGMPDDDEPAAAESQRRHTPGISNQARTWRARGKS